MWPCEVDFIYQFIYPLLLILKILVAIPSAGHITSLHRCLLAIVISFFVLPTTHLFVLSGFLQLFILIEDVTSACSTVNEKSPMDTNRSMARNDLCVKILVGLIWHEFFWAEIIPGYVIR